MSKNIAIILAGGVGSRMKLGYPKQFSKIAGKTALEHTISIFQSHPLIDEIVIVAEVNHYSKITDIVNQASFNKVNRIVYGGKERTDSTLSAIKALSKESKETKLIIHDAVRPLLSTEIITNCILALDSANAVDVVIPATDTIVKVNNKTKEIIEIPNREEYYQGQTPQAFRLGILSKAYEIYINSDIKATCDCGIVLKTMPEEKVITVLGAETNIKLTRPVDLFIADKLFQSRSHFSLRNISCISCLEKLKNKVLVVIGGSYGIGKEIITLAERLNFGVKTYSLSRGTGVDVADYNSVDDALKEIYRKEGQIDYIINTAATLIHKPLSSMDRNDIMNSINTNFTGVINVALAAFPYLKESKGSLLNYASSSYTRGRAFYSVYSSSKAAVVNFTQAISDEWLSDGITINCINPERTKTPMRINAFGIEPDDTLLKAETVALASLFVLVSSETGNIIDVVRKDEEYISGLLNNIVSQ